MNANLRWLVSKLLVSFGWSLKGGEFITCMTFMTESINTHYVHKFTLVIFWLSYYSVKKRKYRLPDKLQLTWTE